ncbi:uroporphyrinogen-III synthase [Arcobacter nitrofigilis DSM 7299]|uniref:Uroporphyrinogen-III synthase n=1 Tax=Arcobacter nitrofigilis (strain ATCC 33309 / DSM 7299 / CCUG 15893 / LMG 7604 / NCTC 12251 / CI) TaxID=572480 RepID=D5UZW6_ARCNC|nr:hypothetical protein [Arcobacter nitrofigilis]ADG93335.1 uroporphyrinogen-III synthase [Arcobacter nitrofigilis DSM 7299]
MKDIKTEIDSLNLAYYEFDNENKVLKFDYDNEYESAKRELIKITYTLTKNNIKFDFLPNRYIVLYKRFTLLQKMSLNILFKINKDYKIYLPYF